MYMYKYIYEIYRDRVHKTNITKEAAGHDQQMNKLHMRTATMFSFILQFTYLQSGR